MRDRASLVAGKQLAMVDQTMPTGSPGVDDKAQQKVAHQHIVETSKTSRAVMG